jgi:hypothetical protein
MEMNGVFQHRVELQASLPVKEYGRAFPADDGGASVDGGHQ